MKLTIDRKTWRRGGIKYEEDGPTSLLNDRGKMCCLGFASLACGLTPDTILYIADPAQVERKLSTFPECMAFLVEGHYNSDVCIRLMSINDDNNINDDLREHRLQRTFDEVGWEVSFVN